MDQFFLSFEPLGRQRRKVSKSERKEGRLKERSERKIEREK